MHAQLVISFHHKKFQLPHPLNPPGAPPFRGCFTLFNAVLPTWLPAPHTQSLLITTTRSSTPHRILHVLKLFFVYFVVHLPLLADLTCAKK